ncbi:RHS repeat-associated protein [Nocardiopsis arvandica]|uniref:RHS repeat-associated protein n=1 Tax=Nocardiopsis sinuspersici TaxID=501010 RepID=A0A7Y9XF17_9ACTN|nr:RHS repeat-associated core domain-containing protein [Nocardiopsis sinuspersici]NYH53607.1 RHS repeat-associated protein [Nocardiopsis sinuspersici]
MSAAACTAASALVLGLLYATPALADTDPHSPADRTVPAPDTWEPGEASTEPVGGEPPDEPWTPSGAGGEAAPEARAENPEPRVATCADGANRGIRSWYPLERHQISDRMELAVNTQDGNVVVRHRDLTVAGTGLDLSVSSFYNSAPSYDGWTLSHGQDVGLQIFSNSVILQGPSGYCERFDIADDGSFTPPPGLNAELEELSNGHYALTFHRGEYEDQVWTFTADGWLYSQADRNGQTHRMRYDTDWNLVSVVDTQDRVTTFDWEGGPTPTVTDATGETAASHTWSGGYDTSTLTDRAGQDVEFGYGDNGLLTSITDATGAVWKIAYNGDDQVTGLTVPDGTEDGATTSYSYGDSASSNTRTTVTDPEGGESTLEFDDQGRQTSATDQVGNTRSQTWTANSDVATTTDALQASVTYDYDAFNNLIGTELPTGATTSVGYTDTANPAKPTSVTTPDGDTLQMSYDDAGNLTSAVQEEMDIEVADVSYHSNGLVAQVTDANGNTTDYSYDRSGNMTAMSEPGPMGTMEFGYDALSRVTEVTDGNGVTLTYGYDRLDRIVSISQGGELLQSIAYDGNGRQIATHTDQASIKHSYNGRGDLLETVRTDSAGSERTIYAYDAAGNLTEMVEHGRTTAYGYDAAFRLTSITDHTGARTTFANDENNRRTGIEHPDGASEERTYDDSGRLTGITTTGAAGQSLVEASYSYDNDGSDSDQLQSRTIQGETETFTYDGLDRLTSDGTTDYTYDDVGNLLTAGKEEFFYNDADQVTTARGAEVGHDAAGNMTSQGERTLEYSATNQFLQADEGSSLATSLSYDTTDQTQMRGVTDVHEGDRIDRQLSNTALGVTNIASGGERTSFVRDPEGRLVSMVAGDGNERFHYTTDHQNTVLALTAEDSEAGSPDVVYDYSPYGERTSESLEGAEAAALSPFGFTGAYQFQDGTVHLNHRFYDTTTLNFTQPDPSRQELNNYAYAACDPINNTDPTGLVSGSCLWAASQFVVGFGGWVGSVGAITLTAGGATPLALIGLAGSTYGVIGGITGMQSSCP